MLEKSHRMKSRQGPVHSTYSYSSQRREKEREREREREREIDKPIREFMKVLHRKSLKG